MIQIHSKYCLLHSGFWEFSGLYKTSKNSIKSFSPNERKKKKKADCFLAEHRRRIAVFSIRATKTVRTGDSKFCSCCVDILNQMTSPTAWILWKVRFQWLQMKMKKQDWGTPKWKPLGWVTNTNQSTLLCPVSPVEFWVQEGRVHDRYPKTSTNLLPSALLCVTTQCKYCQQRNGVSASVVAYSGKAKALPCVVV